MRDVPNEHDCQAEIKVFILVNIFIQCTVHVCHHEKEATVKHSSGGKANAGIKHISLCLHISCFIALYVS